MNTESLKKYEQDIHRLDVALRELKVRYDQFFAGALDRQPFVLRQEVERIIDRITRNPPGPFALRFHFNALVSRFNTFSELWGKTIRGMEEGEHRQKSVAERMGIRERLLTRCVVGDTAGESADLRRMHGRFLDARRRLGKGDVSYEKFVRGIAAQSARLRAKHECSQIEVRLVESDNGVQIKARPRR